MKPDAKGRYCRTDDVDLARRKRQVLRDKEELLDMIMLRGNVLASVAAEQGTEMETLVQNRTSELEALLESRTESMIKKEGEIQNMRCTLHIAESFIDPKEKHRYRQEVQRYFA